MAKLKVLSSIRLAIVAAILTALIFITLFVYLGINLTHWSYNDSKQIAKEVSRKAAVETENYLRSALMAARSMNQRGIIYHQLGANRTEVIEMLLTTLKSNPNFLATWTMWEPNAFDNRDVEYIGSHFFDSLGHFSTTFFRYKDSIFIEKTHPADYLEDYYTIPKQLKKELLIEPYFYKYQGHPYDFFETSVVLPIMINNEFLGVFAIDLNLDSLHTKISNNRLYNKGFLTLISGNGLVVSHADSTYITKYFFEIINDPDSVISNNLKAGNELSVEDYSNFLGEKVFRFFYPITIGKNVNPWYIMAEVPIKEATYRSKQLQYVSYGILAIGLLLLLYLIINIIDRRNYEISLQSSIRQIQESERNYRTIFNSTSEAIFIHDSINGEIIDVNEVMLQMYGYSSKSEVLDQTVAAFSSNQFEYTLEFAKKNLDKALTVGPQTFDWQARRKNGELFWVEVSLRKAIIQEENRILAVVRDITEKKKVAIELNKYKNHLEYLVKERTEELAAANEELSANNELLYEQRKELETTLENLKNAQNLLIHSEKMASLGILAAGVAHEVNNPLNYIQSGVSALEVLMKEKGLDTEDFRMLISSIETGVKRVSDIVISLNRYSRQDESGSFSCDLHMIIDNCFLMLENQTKNRINLIKNFTQSQFQLFGKEGKLHQAFLNLISNAVQSIDGPGTIKISTTIDKKYLIVSISDTGCGIAEENMRKITDPFFTTKEPGKGTGLGLAITYSIIQEHNGWLDFESEVGAGTTVTVNLPIKTD